MKLDQAIVHVINYKMMSGKLETRFSFVFVHENGIIYFVYSWIGFKRRMTYALKNPRQV